MILWAGGLTDAGMPLIHTQGAKIFSRHDDRGATFATSATFSKNERDGKKYFLVVYHGNYLFLYIASAVGLVAKGAKIAPPP
jgi:hypothetical protein